MRAVMNICRFAHDLKDEDISFLLLFFLLSLLSVGGMFWTKHLLCLPEGHALYGIQASPEGDSHWDTSEGETFFFSFLKG